MSFADASVGTDKLFRERFSVLPEMKSKFVQTDASWLRSRSIAVNTDVDPFFGVWRRRRVRGTHPLSGPSATVPSGCSRETQTDVSVPRMKDASAQVNTCCRIDLRSTLIQEQGVQMHEQQPDDHHAVPAGEEMQVEDFPAPQPLPSTSKESGSLTSLSSMEMDSSPEPTPMPTKRTVDQASSPVAVASPSPPPPPPPPPPPAVQEQRMMMPSPGVEVMITPPPPISLLPPDAEALAPVSPPCLPLPPAPRVRSAVTSGTNSQNASDEEEEESDNKRFKSLRDEEYFKKYAMRPRRGTLTLRSVKARSESRRPSAVHGQNETRIQSPVRQTDTSAVPPDVSFPVSPVVETMAPAAVTAGSGGRESPQRKISNVSSNELVAELLLPQPVTSPAEAKGPPPPPAATSLPPAPTPVASKPLVSNEYVEKLKDPESESMVEKEGPKKRKEVLSASSPNLLSDDSSGTSIVEAVNVNEAEVKSEGSGAKNQMMIKVMPREMRTESKIVIEVINSRRREVSEVTSYSEVQPDGKITRKTTVTTSKKVPVMAIGPATGDPLDERTSGQSFPPRRHPGKTPEPIVTSPLSTKATSSPVPRHAKSMTTMQSVAPSECSTRPTSAAEDVTIGITPASSQMDSFASSAASPDAGQRSTGSSFLQQPPDRSHFLSPAYSDPEVEKVAKIMQQVFDPYHLVVHGPQDAKHESTQSVPTTLSRKGKSVRPESETAQQTIADRYNSSARSPPPATLAETSQTRPSQSQRRRPRVYWHETSHSTVTNEMVTDAYKDDSGSIVKPKGVTMHTETLIDNMGKDSKVTTRSKAQRQFAGQVQEPEITAETTISDEPPILQIEPRRLGFPRRATTLALSQPPPSIPQEKEDKPEKQDGSEVHAESPAEKKRPSSRIPRVTPVPTPTPATIDRKKRMKSDPGKISVKSSGIGSVESTSAMSTPLKSTSRTSIKSPAAFMESSLDHLDDLDIGIPDVLSPNILSTDISSRDPGSRADSGLLTSPLSPSDRKSRRERIIESARKGQLFSDVNKALYGKSLSFADLNGDGPGSRTRKSSVDAQAMPSVPNTDALQKHHPKLKSSNDLDKVLPILPSLVGSKSGTELVTKITRRTHPSEIVDVNGSKILRPKRSKMVLEQDIKTGDGTYDTTGCHMLNKITVDNPSVKKKSKNPFGSFSLAKLKRKSSHQQLAIESDEQEKENGSKDNRKKGERTPSGKNDRPFSKSMGDLRAPEAEEEEDEEENQGVMLTETKFERLVPNPATGRSNHQTSWEYSLECKCVNGLNTSVK